MPFKKSLNIIIFSLFSISYLANSSDITDREFYSDIYQDPLTIKPKPHELKSIPRWKSFKEAVIRQALFLLQYYSKPEVTFLVYGRDGEIIYDTLKYLSYYLFQDKHQIHLINISSLHKSTDTNQYPIYDNQDFIPEYYSQFGVNKKQLKKGKHFILVDTGFRGTIPQQLRKSFDSKYHPQFHIELLISKPDLNDNQDDSASLMWGIKNPPPASRFALMAFDAFLPYRHPYLINSQIAVLTESLPHSTKTSCEIDIHPKRGLWEALSERELDQNILELAQKVRQDVHYTILTESTEIKNVSRLVKKVIQIYQSKGWNRFYELFFKTRPDASKTLDLLSKHKLEFIALLQDLDEREHSAKKREFFEDMGVFFQEFKNTSSSSQSLTFEGFYHLKSIEGIFNSFPLIREQFLNLLEIKKYDELNFMIESIDGLVFMDQKEDDYMMSWQKGKLQKTIDYLHSILTKEKLKELIDNTVLSELLTKHDMKIELE